MTDRRRAASRFVARKVGRVWGIVGSVRIGRSRRTSPGSKKQRVAGDRTLLATGIRRHAPVSARALDSGRQRRSAPQPNLQANTPKVKPTPDGNPNPGIARGDDQVTGNCNPPTLQIAPSPFLRDLHGHVSYCSGSFSRPPCPS
jgi:hypothetical protein